MAQWIVRTPVKDYAGASAGVAFTDGVAVVDDVEHAAALRYFRRAGYDVSSASPAPVPAGGSRSAGTERPARNASKQAWVEFAVAQFGEDERAHIESLSKAQIVKECS